MKKLMALLMAVMMMALLCAASGEEAPAVDPAGLKFDSDWAVEDGIMHIYQEEEGYRVDIKLYNQETGGSVWEYSCLYNGQEDQLVSVSALRRDFTLDDMLEEVYAEESAYEFFAENESIFIINDEGLLLWNDPVDHAGDGLTFRNIGRFEGNWKGDHVKVRIVYDEFEGFYSVLLTRVGDETTYTDFLMNGVYNPETGKLEALGTATTFTLVNGEYVAGEEDGETYEAFFSWNENGTLIFEAENGIELEWDLDSEG